MALRIYNSLTHRKEEFIPLEPGNAGIYVCGVTVYDEIHIGHARTLICFDAVVRYLRHLGYRVNYVRNFTDIDDKIVKRAHEEGVESAALAERYIQEFRKDLAPFNLIQPDFEPRVTEHIPEIIGLIEKLIASGWAYVADGNVFYAVNRFADYGKLSRQNREDMLIGARVEAHEKKRDPLDFALWKGAKPGEPSWPSPWGEGRPGWHIECSAMSMKYLGQNFDIHGGGADLIFPHHENEIAQSEAALGRSWVRYWMHSGMLTIDGEKMSKSLGNFITVKEIISRYDPELIRFFFLSHHYRSNVDFSESRLQEKAQGLERIYTTLRELEERLAGSQAAAPGAAGEGQAAVAELEAEFYRAMNDDFNTARAIGVIFELVSFLNSRMAGRRERPSQEDLALFHGARRLFQKATEVLGLFGQAPTDYLEGARYKKLAKIGIPLAEIERLISERNEARKKRDWTRADAIRSQLAAHKILLQDTPDGTTWTVADP